MKGCYTLWKRFSAHKTGKALYLEYKKNTQNSIIRKKLNLKWTNGLYRHVTKLGFPGGSLAKNPPANAGDVGLLSELGRSHGEGNSDSLQYSCLENPMDRGAWQATVHGVTRVRHNLVTKNNNNSNVSFKASVFFLIFYLDNG